MLLQPPQKRAVFVLVYTLIGGFLAESASDFMQALVMIIALGVIVFVGTTAAGGLDAVIDNVRNIPSFLEFFGIATPETVDGVQQVAAGTPGIREELLGLVWDETDKKLYNGDREGM